MGYNRTLKATAIAAVLLMSHALQAADKTDSASYVAGDIGPHDGTVYFVDASGEHGLEAKAADEMHSLNWNDAVSAASANGDGWRLPSKTELKLLYEQRSLVGGFANDDYWSATELDSISAWIQGFFNGDQDRYNKYSTLKVRAVHPF
ncbi:MAG: DUF1566 domain-containing protein [Methylomicrobium sp.]|nr:DUF1566 domain-containing protein [Methylomicrobium sp.]